PDGATHSGSFDLSFLRCIPNMLIMAPSDERECRLMLSTGYQHKGPAAVRYPRGTGTGITAGEDLETIDIGKAKIVRTGEKLAILSFGSTLSATASVAIALNASLIDMRFIKPLDEALIIQLAQNHERFVTVEDNAVMGGAGSAVSEFLNQQNIRMDLLQLGLPDIYQEHASREELLVEAGIDSVGIQKAITDRWH
ncbi:MAG TPA: transketolase C-terminal domain-containing protein, partial [Arenimonas sp.]|nr:transketolase C-terminal domain-containing protein [Arenimonas sp.]